MKMCKSFVVGTFVCFAVLAPTLCFAAGERQSLNPQPIPPGSTKSLNPQPIPPGKQGFVPGNTGKGLSSGKLTPPKVQIDPPRSR